MSPTDSGSNTGTAAGPIGGALSSCSALCRASCAGALLDAAASPAAEPRRRFSLRLGLSGHVRQLWPSRPQSEHVMVVARLSRPLLAASPLAAGPAAAPR